MFELSIILGLVIAAVIYFKIKNKNQLVEVAQEPVAASSPVKPEVQELVAEKIVEDDAVVVDAKDAPEPISEAVLAEHQSVQVNSVVSQKTPESSLLPQDSILKRHFLTQVQVYVEGLLPAQPTDSVLSRHYNSLLTNKLAHVLSNQEVLNELVEQYKLSKKELVVKDLVDLKAEQPIVSSILEPQVQSELPKVPEDSVLRRHYVTQLRSLIESDLPEKPTDSVLKRHWQTLSDDALNKRL